MGRVWELKSGQITPATCFQSRSHGATHGKNELDDSEMMTIHKLIANQRTEIALLESKVDSLNAKLEIVIQYHKGDNEFANLLI